MNLTARIAIVEADQAFRKRLSDSLSSRFNNKIIEFNTCDELQESLQIGELDAAIIGVQASHENSCEFIRNLHRRFPEFPLAIVADFQEIDQVLDGLAAGARVAFGRSWAEERISSSLEQLVHQIREVQASQFSPRSLEQADLKF